MIAAPIIAPIEAIPISLHGIGICIKCPIAPAKAIKVIIITEVPTAFLNFIPIIIVKTARIVNPPPAPKIPEIKPTIDPKNIDAKSGLFLK